ncbi:MAG: permease-like cell division protein FtsX [Thermodesulfovibrio sp.]|nr:permease-like cell division protein FtsX [Thermodesulfovibrio sp.]
MNNYLGYAIKNLWTNKWSTLMAILSIAVCFFIITLIAIGLYNLNIFTKKLSNKAAMVIYLKNGLSQTEIAQFTESLQQKNVFSKIKFISKEEALKEMKDIIEPSLIELIGFNPLSDTVEAFIKDEKLNTLEEIKKELKNHKYVEDIYYPTNIINILKMLKITLWNLGIVILSLLGLSIFFIIYATVKNHYWKKEEEIEILKLLGATPSYIRYPFLTEGGLLGIAGSLIAALSIFFLYFILYSKEMIDYLPAISQLILPTEVFYLLPSAGMLLGIISSLIALGKIRYQ